MDSGTYLNWDDEQKEGDSGQGGRSNLPDQETRAEQDLGPV